MIVVKKRYRKLLLAPLRLVHPVHRKDPLYDECYKRFFHVTGIRETPKVLSEVAKMPSILCTRPGYTKRYNTRPDNLEEVDPTEGDDDIEAPSGETMEHIDNVLGKLKPSDFDTAGFDDHPTEATQESLIIDIFGSNHVTSLTE